MGDLVCVRIVFPKSLVIEFFSPTYKAIVWQAFPCKVFFVRNQYAGYFFSEITHTTAPPPSKVKWSALKSKPADVMCIIQYKRHRNYVWRMREQKSVLISLD